MSKNRFFLRAVIAGTVTVAVAGTGSVANAAKPVTVFPSATIMNVDVAGGSVNGPGFCNWEVDYTVNDLARRGSYRVWVQGFYVTDAGNQLSFGGLDLVSSVNNGAVLSHGGGNAPNGREVRFQVELTEFTRKNPTGVVVDADIVPVNVSC